MRLKHSTISITRIGKAVLILPIIVLLVGFLPIKKAVDLSLISYILSAKIHVQQTQYTHAITLLDRAISSSPGDAALYVLRARTFLLLYEWDKVLADCNTAIELDLTYAEAYYQRGLLYYSILQTGSTLYEKALADFEMYRNLAPNGVHVEEASQYIMEIEAQQQALNS